MSDAKFIYGPVERDTPTYVADPDFFKPGLLKYKKVETGDTAITFGIMVDGTQYAVEHTAFMTLFAGMADCLFDWAPEDEVPVVLGLVKDMLDDVAAAAHDKADPGWSI